MNWRRLRDALIFRLLGGDAYIANIEIYGELHCIRAVPTAKSTCARNLFVYDAGDMPAPGETPIEPERPIIH